MIKNKSFLTRNEIFSNYSKEKESVLVEAISISNHFNDKKIQLEDLNKKKANLEQEKVFFKFFNFFEKRKVGKRMFVKDMYFFMMVLPFLVFTLLFSINVAMSEAKGILNKYPEKEIAEYSNILFDSSVEPIKMSKIEKEKYEIVKYYKNLNGALTSFVIFISFLSMLIFFNIVNYIYIKSFKEKLWLVDYRKILQEINAINNDMYFYEDNYKKLLRNNPFISNNSIVKVLMEIYRSSDQLLNEINKKTFLLVYDKDLKNCFNPEIKNNAYFYGQGREHIEGINNNLNFYRKS